MAVKIRLARAGTKKVPFYHVVATDSRSPRDGKFLEQLGFYDPRQNPTKINLNQEKLAHWIKMGAKPSQTVAELIKKAQKSA